MTSSLAFRKGNESGKSGAQQQGHSIPLHILCKSYSTWNVNIQSTHITALVTCWVVLSSIYYFDCCRLWNRTDFIISQF